MAGETYVKRYAAGFIDSDQSKPADAQFLNAVEAALLRLLGADPIDHGVSVWDAGLARFAFRKLLNADIDAAAAISRSKLDFGGGLVDADVAAGAAIAGSKLAGGIGLSKISTAGEASLAVNLGAASTDLAAPAGLVDYWVATTGGGTLRSIGAGVFAGCRITLKNGTAASFITLKHQLAGGTGAQLSIINSGDKYLAPGQSIELVYDGTNWQEVNRPSHELICDLALTASQASFDTNTILGGNIPQVYSHLRAVLHLRCDQAVTVQDTWARFNNDSAANYDTQRLRGVAATASATEFLAQAQMYVGGTPGTSAIASSFGIVVIDIPYYTSASALKSLVASYGQKSGNASGNLETGTWYGSWRTAAALTRLQILASTGNFVAVSRFSLIGVT
jgi:hypothetical protein